MLPLMGLGTFIGVELDCIKNHQDRMDAVKSTVFNALKIGYRHIDLAENYGNLPAIGLALEQAMSPKSDGGLGLKRDDLWLTMKSTCYSLSAINAYIEDLKCGYLDTYTLHFPSSFFTSEQTLMRAWKEVTKLPTSLVKTAGVSNFYPKHIERLLSVCDKYNLPKPFSNEIESNLLCPNYETIELCQAHGIQIIAYSPLGYQYASSLTNADDLNGSPLLTASQSISATPAQTVLAWLMARNIAVIPKSTQLHRLEENFNATSHIDSINEAVSEQLKEMHSQMPALTGTAENCYYESEGLTWSVKPEPSPSLASHSIFRAPPTETIADAKLDTTQHDETSASKRSNSPS